jgi:hypothetical protein
MDPEDIDLFDMTQEERLWPTCDEPENDSCFDDYTEPQDLDAESGRYDDDPNPYEGTYSEE